jgi:ABC-type uncharacterized transport system substrate-binding protein
MARPSRLFIAFISTVIFGLGLAQAHPHLRLAYQLDPLLDPARQLTGFHVSWQMDAQNALMVRENIDLNQNGQLDQDELQAFAQTNQSLMQHYQYFLTIEEVQSGKPLNFQVKDFVARDAGRGFQGGIFLEFTVQMSSDKPMDQVKLHMQDPTWYIGFQPRLGQVLSSDTCASDFTREKRLTASQGEQEFQRIHVQCALGSVARPEAQVSPINGPINGDNS